MGFYGKVTNNNATQFIIDKIYPNRVTMEATLNASNDGVLIGRYALIEYDQEVFPRLYKTTEVKNGQSITKFYFSRSLNEESRAKFLTEEEYQASYDHFYGDRSYYTQYYLRENDYIYVLDENYERDFYICNNTQSDSNGSYATFTSVEEPLNSNSSYFENFRIDRVYGDSRGFDSTVWQKVFVDGKEKYVMIAELNSVVPTFDLTVDAPTSVPVKPHFDADSTNVYYKLHVQPNWGFRIKDSSVQTTTSDDKSYPSDLTIDYIEQVYDPEEKVYHEEPRSYDGAVYFNKDGFNPARKVISSNVDNEITIKPTGKSLEAYNIHDPNNPNKCEVIEDTQELVMMLPGVGDAISALWDIVYNDPGENQERNLNVEWGSYQGVRMVNTSNDGYSYEPEKTETLAGAINSVHDLMGMIIDNQYKDLSTVPLGSIDTNKIYYYNKKFYIKEKGLDWVEAKEGVSPYKEISLVDSYAPNTYYLKNLNQDYELSADEEMREGVSYYKLTNIKEIGLDPEYRAGTYYYLDGNDYKKDTGTSYDKNKTYFKNLTATNVVKSSKYFYIVQKHEEYEPGKFRGLWYRNANNVAVPCDETCTLSYEQIKGLNPFIGVYTKIEEWSPSENKIVTTPNFSQETAITLVKFDTSKKYYKKSNDNYLYVTKLPEKYYSSHVNYYTITATKIENFYERNKYYYLTPQDTKNYRWGSGAYSDSYTYYTLTAQGPYQYFYEPNKYYYKSGNTFKLDSQTSMTTNRTYYRHSELYVHPDNKNTNFINGSLWNTKLNKDNFTDLTLGYCYDDWQWKELKGFARTLNTIHGLIIEVNNILKVKDTLTRDTKTVQGCINKINDIINVIETLTPGHFMAVNEYGKMTTMEPQGDSWINIAINANNNDKVIITHTGPVEDEARTIGNKTPKFGGTFTIEDWSFDSKGHKSSKGTHTVKIPEGSLTDADANGADVITQLAFTSNTGALSTTRTNIANLKLTDYVKTTNNADITSTDTLGAALSKLQTQIIEEENARSSAVNALDMAENSSSTQFISKISQTDGKLAVERATAGTLVLSNSNEAIATKTAEGIKGTDSIVTAFGKVEAQIKAESTTRSNADTSLRNDLNTEIATRENAISQEALARTTADTTLQSNIDKEVTARQNAINDLTITTIAAGASEVFSSIGESKGIISATTKDVGELTLKGLTIDSSKSGNILGSDTINTAFAKIQNQLTTLNGNSSTQGSVAYQIAQIVSENANGSIDTLNEIAAWIINDTTGAAKMNADIASLQTLVGNSDVATQIANAIDTALMVNGQNKYALAADLLNLISEYQITIQELQQADYTLNSRCNVLDTEVKNLINKSDNFISKEIYEEKVAALEQEIYTLNSRCNVLDLEVKTLINKVSVLEQKLVTENTTE